MCPLCLVWFPPLPRQQDCILEYILPTKSKRALSAAVCKHPTEKLMGRGFGDGNSTADKKVYAKIVSLIKDVQREPFSGLGKSEALKHELSRLWLRRITKEHRLVYSVSDHDTKARTSGNALQGRSLQRGRNEKNPLLINFSQK